CAGLADVAEACTQTNASTGTRATIVVVHVAVADLVWDRVVLHNNPVATSGVTREATDSAGARRVERLAIPGRAAKEVNTRVIPVGVVIRSGCGKLTHLRHQFLQSLLRSLHR